MKRPHICEKPCLHVGDVVNYSSVIGEAPTRFNLTVKTEPELLGGHTWVVWLDGKSGCVATAACTLVRRALESI